VDTDEELYGRYLAGDEDALRLLLERYREGLTRFLTGIVGNEQDAEELMMDAFAALLATEKRFAGRSSFKTWLFAIGRHKAVSFLRRRRLFAPLPETASGPEPGEELFAEERHRLLFEALRTLKAEYRDALYLTYFEEMSCAQTARVLGKTERQTSDILYRAKQALRRALGREGVTDAGD
jgi:RNA polymerase sigma factor (sigma-70 family)